MTSEDFFVKEELERDKKSVDLKNLVRTGIVVEGFIIYIASSVWLDDWSLAINGVGLMLCSLFLSQLDLFDSLIKLIKLLDVRVNLLEERLKKLEK